MKNTVSTGLYIIIGILFSAAVFFYLMWGIWALLLLIMLFSLVASPLVSILVVAFLYYKWKNKKFQKYSNRFKNFEGENNHSYLISYTVSTKKSEIKKFLKTATISAISFAPLWVAIDFFVSKTEFGIITTVLLFFLTIIISAILILFAVMILFLIVMIVFSCINIIPKPKFKIKKMKGNKSHG